MKTNILIQEKNMMHLYQKHKMKNEIRKTSIPFDINPKHIYNEISEEIGLICPKYNSIKYQDI